MPLMTPAAGSYCPVGMDALVVHVPLDCCSFSVSTEARCDATNGGETLEQPEAGKMKEPTISAEAIESRLDMGHLTKVAPDGKTGFSKGRSSSCLRPSR